MQEARNQIRKHVKQYGVELSIVHLLMVIGSAVVLVWLAASLGAL